MSEDSAGLCTLTSFDKDRSLRLPTIVVTVTRQDRTVEARLGMNPLVVGTSPECDLIVHDPKVSRRHCELRMTKRGIWLRDLGSKNGTLVGKVPVLEALLPPSVPVIIGSSELTASPVGGPSILPLSSTGRFGDAIGQSLLMRALFAKLERASATEETILLLGESGTGKEVLARAIHDHSLRREGPFIVFDCGAVSPSLVESELFGHVRGAFTGAATAYSGLLEQASGGTLFIDEIGELPLELQPKLLRVLEARQMRRLGGTEWKSFDARVIAATHRNLKAKVAEGSFRGDLYYRLAVVDVYVPALRERKEDIPGLAERFLAAQIPARKLADLPPHALALLEAHDWPGNVRELRNMVARLVLFPDLIEELIEPMKVRPEPGSEGAQPESRTTEEEIPGRLGALLDVPLPQAREMVMEQFERSYVTLKLRQHGGNISRAADAMGVSRQLVHRLIDRYELRVK
jgi:transcriptional regulator with PAS, ATPase and Fis domain